MKEPLQPTSALALEDAWYARDEQYAGRKLTDGEIAAIRANRALEAGFVEPQRRAEMWRIAARVEAPGASLVRPPAVTPDRPYEGPRYRGEKTYDALDMNRADRRRGGFRGAAVSVRPAAGLPRSVARSFRTVADGKVFTRRERKARARIMRALRARGLG